MFLSMGVRFLCNVEALNMVESIGNLSKHRKAPIVIPTTDGFKLLYVPAISGESLGHAYQQAIVEEAINFYGEKAPLDEWSKRGEFIKFGDLKHMPSELSSIIKTKSGKKEDETVDQKHQVEKTAIKLSIVADIGGFLVAEGVPVKRTSCFQIGYAVPVFDALDSTAMESQFHVRYVASETMKQEESQEGGEEKNQAKTVKERQGQAIYYVELASAVYGFTFNINLDSIGRTSMVKVEDAVTDRLDRMKIALLAAARLFTGHSFGAKRSRFLPIEDVLSLGAVVSRQRPFVISPPQFPDFVENTVKRADSMKEMLRKFGKTEETKIFAYSKEKQLPDGVVKADSVEQLFTLVLDEILTGRT